jgi:hypothetical protein
MDKNKEIKVEVEQTEDVIKQRIFIIRGQKVMIDTDLAELYGVVTKRFNEQVKRNKDRFPEDFMFQLDADERDEVVANCDHLLKLKFSHSLPYVFTEHGVAMLSSVLNSQRAIQMNIFIIRAFIKMRENLNHYNDLAIKIGEIEVRQIHDHHMLKNVHDVVKHLINPIEKPRKRVGFNINE